MNLNASPATSLLGGNPAPVALAAVIPESPPPPAQTDNLNLGITQLNPILGEDVGEISKVAFRYVR